jgi:hypothetical protein
MTMLKTDRFEDRLLRELRQSIAARPAPAAPPARGHRRRIAAGAGGLALATVSVAAVVIGTGGTPAAYAVEPGSGGTVTVSIHQLSDAAGLQQALQAAGVDAVVDYDPTGTCTPAPPSSGTGSGTGDGPHVTTGGAQGTTGDGPSTASGSEAGVGTSGDHPALVEGIAEAPGNGRPVMQAGVRVEANGDATFTVTAGAIPQGQRLYITTSGDTPGSLGMSIGTSERCAGAGPQSAAG